MKIHHASNTRSVRAIWLMEELGLPYDVENNRVILLCGLGLLESPPDGSCPRARRR